MQSSELTIKVRVDGADEADEQLSALGARIRRLGDLANTLTSLATAGALFAATFARLSGLDYASQIQQIRLQFQALTGSVDDAERAMQAFLRIAAQTRFDTLEVARFGALMLGMGLSTQQAVDELSQLLDLMSAMGVARSDYDRVMFNLLQLRAGAGTAQDVRQLVMAMPGIGMALARAMGRDQPMTMDDISALIRQRGSQGFFDLLLQAGQPFRGASRRLAIGDALANLYEQIQFALVPSGERLGAILLWLTPAISAVIGVFGRLNTATGGLLGLFASLAVAAAFASSALNLLGRAGLFAGIASLFQLVRGLPALVRGLPALIVSITRVITRLPQMVQSLLPIVLRFIRSAAGVITLLTVVFEALGALARRAGAVALGDWLSTLGMWGGTGAGIGAAIGSIVPAIGTTIGAIVGGIIGLLGGVLRMLYGGRAQDTQNAQQQTARNTAEIAQHMRDLKIHIVGGGANARNAMTRYEVEAYLQRLASAGI